MGASKILERKEGSLQGEGKSIWHYVNVQDLSNLYLYLGVTTVAGGGRAI